MHGSNVVDLVVIEFGVTVSENVTEADDVAGMRDFFRYRRCGLI